MITIVTPQIYIRNNTVFYKSKTHTNNIRVVVMLKISNRSRVTFRYFSFDLHSETVQRAFHLLKSLIIYIIYLFIYFITHIIYMYV